MNVEILKELQRVIRESIHNWNSHLPWQLGQNLPASRMEVCIPYEGYIHLWASSESIGLTLRTKHYNFQWGSPHQIEGRSFVLKHERNDLINPDLQMQFRIYSDNVFTTVRNIIYFAL